MNARHEVGDHLRTMKSSRFENSSCESASAPTLLPLLIISGTATAIAISAAVTLRFEWGVPCLDEALMLKRISLVPPSRTAVGMADPGWRKRGDRTGTHSARTITAALRAAAAATAVIAVQLQRWRNNVLVSWIPVFDTWARSNGYSTLKICLDAPASRENTAREKEGRSQRAGLDGYRNDDNYEVGQAFASSGRTLAFAVGSDWSCGKAEVSVNNGDMRSPWVMTCRVERSTTEKLRSHLTVHLGTKMLRQPRASVFAATIVRLLLFAPAFTFMSTSTPPIKG